MRILFALMLFIAFTSSSAAQTKDATIQPPGKSLGHDDFFTELRETMKKYPEAAKRFSLYDNQAKSRASGSMCNYPNEVECCVQYCPGLPHWCCATEGCCTLEK